MDIMMMDSSRY